MFPFRTTFFGRTDKFPVRFCHNDIQESKLDNQSLCTINLHRRITIILILVSTFRDKSRRNNFFVLEML